MVPLEDTLSDILGKAQRGMKLSNEVLAREAAIPLSDYERLCNGQLDESIVRKVAPLLKLSAERLIQIAKGEWHPHIPQHPEGFARVITPFNGGTVNAYVLWDPVSREAAIFDTGMDSAPLLQVLQEKQLQPKFIFLTHTHTDHIAELPNLGKATGAPAHVHKNEDIGGVTVFDWGQTFTVGNLKIETRQTTGHAEGGTTYYVGGLEVPVAVVGDAIFAGSIGGGRISYEEALRTNRQNILSLPDQTVLCPGHGPLTTVGIEKACNPFFPEFEISAGDRK